ncbi:NADP-reducing hydrogenase subunit HndA [Limihaloglobus sulfuriphilus]|uniref:NADP-reducing hydrogenase subunit HndA n=1 Tax=Limihaloglobus sulfuriphilus TaxID=1851148 RepID=A0A1Q2MAN0_9BACT|nr:NADH-quinone oxidoreductase subunit NuoE [Limihaloglobus sulfuriphilus]AQQ69720.1 NADP-reducing hydrogenase subunit HndA [Limihaloglobus sulfuriphilus]
MADKPKSRSQLLPLLQKVQEQEGYISDENMQKIADRLGIHPVEVYSVVSFYAFLSTKPQGKHIIRVSTCVPCMMAGADNVIKAFEKALGINAGQTTPDNKFTLEKTSCIGMCDQAPAVLIDDKLMGFVAPEKVSEILRELA